MKITIPERHLAFLALAAEQAFPRESCAILLGRSGGEVNVVVRCANVHADPLRHYSIDARELIRVQRVARSFGLQIVGFHHSHPDHDAAPSETDLAEANWSGCVYVISEVRRGRVRGTRGFKMAGKAFENCELQTRSSSSE